jgi:hypothetical protein
MSVESNDFAELFVFKGLAAFSFRVFPWGRHRAEKNSVRHGEIPPCVVLSALTHSAKGEPFERRFAQAFSRATP